MPSPHLAVAPNEPGPSAGARDLTVPDSAAPAQPPPNPDAGGPNPGAGRPPDVVTRLRRTLRTSLRAQYTWESLPMAHVEILHTLAEQPGMRISDIAAELRLPQGTVSSVIRQMADDGLVERNPAATDRRVMLVCLSQKGLDQLTGWQGAHRQRIAQALNKLAQDELVDELNAP